MGHWSEAHMDDGWGLAMLLVMLGFGALIALALGAALVWSSRFSRAHVAPSVGAFGVSAVRGDTAEAEQILAVRLARGEIDTEEYRARVDLLRTTGPN